MNRTRIFLMKKVRSMLFVSTYHITACSSVFLIKNLPLNRSITEYCLVLVSSANDIFSNSIKSGTSAPLIRAIFFITVSALAYCLLLTSHLKLSGTNLKQRGTVRLVNIYSDRTDGLSCKSMWLGERERERECSSC